MKLWVLTRTWQRQVGKPRTPGRKNEKCDAGGLHFRAILSCRHSLAQHCASENNKELKG